MAQLPIQPKKQGNKKSNGVEVEVWGKWWIKFEKVGGGGGGGGRNHLLTMILKEVLR